MSSSESNVDAERLLDHYRAMWRIRAFEEAAAETQAQGHVGGAVHQSIGQEAVASGICVHLHASDRITTNHRGHGHSLAKGTDATAMMLELCGKVGGTCGGKGGSMHIADFSVGMLGANGVVAAGIPIAVGAAHGARLRGEDCVTVCFFGDGAVNRGPFLEGLNWARIFDLPVLFVCEDNGFASTTRRDAVTGGAGPGARAESLGIPARTVDGNDVMLVDALAGEMIAAIRAGGGPMLLHARTYRLRGHTVSDPAAYRPADEVEAAGMRDPLVLARASLEAVGVTSQAIEAAERAARDEMGRAAETAIAAPTPALAEAFTDVQDLGAPA